MSDRGRKVKGRRLPPGMVEYRRVKASQSAREPRKKQRGKWDGPILGFIYVET